MIERLDPVLLARIQFAFTISFHIIFPAFTIGLASWLAVLEWRWLKTGNTVYEEIYRMWVKIFAVTFGMGVVSGVVMSFQFGTNWSVFSDRAGNVLGPLAGLRSAHRIFFRSLIFGGDALWLEPCEQKNAFCRHHYCCFRNPDFGLLDPIGQ